MDTDMEIDTPRGQSNVSSTNSSRESPVHSSASSVPYAERMQALNNNPSWTDQVENNEFQGFSLFYASPKTGDIDKANKATAIANIPEPQGGCVNELDPNTCQPHGLETSSIPYLINQPMDPRLWDDSVHSISIYGLNEHLEVDADNIATSLHRIVLFIKNKFLNGKMENNVPHIVGLATLVLHPYHLKFV